MTAPVSNTPIQNTPVPNTPTQNTPTKNTPTKDTPIPNTNDLVELLKLDNSFIIDMKYATEDNFTKKVIYPSAKCILHKNTAAKLIKANMIQKLGTL